MEYSPLKVPRHSVNTIAASNPIYSLEQNHQILDPFAFNKFGRAVSLSGNRALVSSYGDYIDSGAVYFYEYNGDSWIEKQKTTTNENGDSLGITLSISGVSHQHHVDHLG